MWVFGAKRARKVAALMSHAIWRRALMHGIAAAVEHQRLATLIQPITVVDIGANKGQFTLFALQAFQGCRIFAFEPLPDPAKRFKSALNRFASVTLFDAAIGPTSGTAEIHISKREDSSSLLPITDRMADIFPEATWSGRTQAVRVGQLADFLTPGDILRPSLLKLDVQGYELQALEGCRSLLKHFDNLYVECSEIMLYEGQPMKADIVAFAASCGFQTLMQLNEVNHANVGPVQCDVLFGRTPTDASLRDVVRE